MDLWGKKYAFPVALGFSLLLLCGMIALYGLGWDYTRAGQQTQIQTLMIDKGSSTDQIAQILHERGLIRDPLFFKIHVLRTRQKGFLQAGEYEFAAHSSVAMILKKMRTGDVVRRQFTLAEGLTVKQILKILSQLNPPLEGDAPNVEVITEGSLFPSTYEYQRDETIDHVVQRMQNSMTDLLKTQWDSRDPSVDDVLKTPQDALILASIIEKETGLGRERAAISGVFINRLRISMRLQTDPTVIYALTKGEQALGRRLWSNDLKIDSPYNTYLYAGLPPTPICNVGRDSLYAALHPQTHKFLYFVADGSGGHVFAPDLATHNKNVAKWRVIRKKQIDMP
jgi:UPF0755 protein